MIFIWRKFNFLQSETDSRVRQLMLCATLVDEVGYVELSKKTTLLFFQIITNIGREGKALSSWPRTRHPSSGARSSWMMSLPPPSLTACFITPIRSSSRTKATAWKPYSITTTLPLLEGRPTLPHRKPQTQRHHHELLSLITAGLDRHSLNRYVLTLGKFCWERWVSSQGELTLMGINLIIVRPMNKESLWSQWSNEFCGSLV